MTKKDSIKNLIIDFVKFGIVGVINTFTSYAIINICYYLLKINIQIANLLAFIISVLVSFLLNNKFVFNKNKDNTVKTVLFRVFKTYLSYSFTGLFLSAILIEIEVNKIGIPAYIATLLNLFITVPVNFLLNKFFAFKEKKDKVVDYSQMAKEHTFAICAYKESPYLEECIKSVINQEVKTNYLIITSTPNDKIKGLAEKYKISYYVREGKSDIQDDWNFAYNKAKTKLVTVTHQDDIYEPNYTKEIFKKYDPNILIYNTNYNPYKNGIVNNDINCKIKNLLKIFVRHKFLSKLKFFKVMSLAFGNSINCPSVTYNKRILGDNFFTSDLKFALDWDTFLKIAKMKGGMLYIPKKLINYRIHDEATTKQFIVDNKRIEEDFIMFNKFWPKCIVKIIMKFYTKSYDVY